MNLSVNGIDCIITIHPPLVLSLNWPSEEEEEGDEALLFALVVVVVVVVVLATLGSPLRNLQARRS